MYISRLGIGSPSNGLVRDVRTRMVSSQFKHFASFKLATVGYLI